MNLPIIRCQGWGARPPRRAPVPCGRPVRVIDHHTAGHAPQLDHLRSETLAEAKAYARAIQAFHMGPERGWNDSGHNFLVTRSGHVLEGRHGTVDALLAGRMVVSAHCPGQNTQPGVEHEHTGREALTLAQVEASVRLHVWLCVHAGIRPSQFEPHRKYFPTSCPGVLVDWLPELRRRVAQELGRR